MEDRMEQEIDLSVLWRGIQRRLGWIVAVSVVLALAVYLWSRSQPTVYEASSSIIASNTQGQDGILGSALVKAPPLPDGAVSQAIQSTLVIGPLVQALQRESLFSIAERARLVASLQKELREQKLKTIGLTSRLDPNGNGIYTVTAQSRTAQGAERLANLATTALLNWDSGRALLNIEKAKAGFRAQLFQVERQIAAAAQTSVERQTLITRRATTQDNLAQVTILETSATGVLSLLSAAVQPLAPLSPKPFRNAVLAGLLVLLMGVGLVALQTILDRTIRSEDDLLVLNVATLGVIPRLRKRDIVFSGIVRAARQAGLYEAVGFLRVNLLTAFQNQSHPVLMISSTAPGEGKSSLTATLADGFASSGQRVLIVDADLRRGTQAEVWQKFSQESQWQQLSGVGGVRTSQEAFGEPANVQVLRTEENVDVLPAGPSVQDSLGLLNKADIGAALTLWRQKYDIILIDSAPLLALADGLVVGAHTDGVLMVTEFGKTSAQAVKGAIRRADRAGLKILGFVINKAERQREDSYGYEYSPRKISETV
ncbi:AAA family ATPase [Deinococcus altitudinis]|uniref:polysaccharide biosynthesis tyrosine autokinase n=1 Tax=Deinococcus altitudinis TaxID=468914 RepID=UPI0038920C1D